MGGTRKLIRAAEIVLAVILGTTYLLAKIHFFTRYGSDDYFAKHWPFWAAMVVVLVFLVILEAIDKLIAPPGDRSSR